MSRKIFGVFTALGFELKLTSLIKKIPSVNGWLLRKGWSDKNDAYYHRIFTSINDVFQKKGVYLPNTRILELGSGNLPRLGDYFIKHCGVSEFVASDPYRRNDAADTALSGLARLKFIKLDLATEQPTKPHAGYFDIAISNAVLEHISRNSCAQAVKNINQTLKIGGYSFHQIDLKDHLNGRAAPFNFYKYDESTWESSTSGTIFYTNRLRCSDWIGLFQASGFEIQYLFKYRNPDSKFPKKISPYFSKYDVNDLNVRTLDILVKKMHDV